MGAAEEPLSFFESLAALWRFRHKPFPSFARLQSRALGILYERSVKDVETATHEIKSAIELLKTHYVEDETERQIDRLYEDGGWELAYLPGSNEENFYPTREEIAELIHHWPSGAADPRRLPSYDDIDDIDALRELMFDDLWHYAGRRRGPERYLNLDMNTAEAFAVLTLIKLNDAASFLLRPEPQHGKSRTAYYDLKQWQEESLIAAANIVIEATEIICFAEAQLSREEQYELRAKERQASPSEAESEAAVRTKISRQALAARYAQNHEARKFVQEAWSLERDHYHNNKSDFVRTYVGIVANRFKDRNGAPLKVTHKHMREVWLSDTPSTSTKAL